MKTTVKKPLGVYSDGYNQNNGKQQVLVRMRGTGALVHCCWERTVVQLLWRTFWWFLKKLYIELPYDSVIHL